MKLSALTLAGLAYGQGSGDYSDYTDLVNSSDDKGFSAPAFNFGNGRAGTPATAVSCWESNGNFEGASNPNFDAGTDGYVHHLSGFANRLSGCIYETPSWAYNSNTYNNYHTMAYADDESLDPVWFHYFNAHVLPGGSFNSHKIVMANPAFEGLGFLNFIVTFKTEGVAQADVNGSEEDSYAAGEKFELTYNTATWETSSFADGAPTLAMSSFPNNDLGQDFRFNLRILHTCGGGGACTTPTQSYYFYRVNEIAITFPQRVGYFQQAADSARSQIQSGANVPPEPQGNFLSEGFTTLDEGSAGDWSDYCSTTLFDSTRFTEAWKCGTDYSASGFLNSYNEAHQNAYGSVQEFWFQFKYMFATYTGTDTMDRNMDNGVPNKLFNSFEVTSISTKCNTGSSNNEFVGNTCS